MTKRRPRAAHSVPARASAASQRPRKGKGARAAFADILRAAIAKSGKSQYALAKETGISQGRIGAFIRGDSNDIRLPLFEALCGAIGLVLA